MLLHLRDGLKNYPDFLDNTPAGELMLHQFDALEKVEANTVRLLMFVLFHFCQTLSPHFIFFVLFEKQSI